MHRYTILAAERSAKVTKQLSIILPNIGGASEPKRRILASVVESILLYVAPFWIKSASTKAIEKLEAVHKRSFLRVVCGYRTSSYAALAVIASTPPLHLLAEERRTIRGGTTKENARASTLAKWQRKWETACMGRWTYKLIPYVKSWCNRRQGAVSYHMTQFLTGYGCFRAYLKRFNRSDIDMCPICRQAIDERYRTRSPCLWRMGELEARSLRLSRDRRAHYVKYCANYAPVKIQLGQNIGNDQKDNEEKRN